MPETNRPEADQSGKSPETLAEEDRDEVLRLSLDEAKKTYFEFWLSDNNETAKSKAIQKIHELLTGEYDDLVLPATEKFLAELEKETTPEETVHLEKIIAEPGKKSAANSEPVEPMPAPAELPVEEEPIEIQPLAADKINPPVVPVVSKVEPPTTDKIPPRLTRPRAEGPTRKSEISDQEKDVIVQTTLDVFQETLKTSSVGAAENAARIKFRESAWELGEATYKELLQKVTQKINELETAERERIKPPMDATVERPAAPAVESPPPAADISKPKNEELEAKDKENIITKSIEVYDEAITEGKDVAEAEAASLRKFTELVQGMERTEAVEIITELKSVWRKKKKEEGKTSVSAPTVERRAGPPVGTEKLDEN
ncbi:MAG: hypothetical protein HYT38_01925, partial [Candidatus Sungbacteria bacterium]|nr:hypothetical protein [Candidatus Sungbacteria bacterium]